MADHSQLLTPPLHHRCTNIFPHAGKIQLADSRNQLPHSSHGTFLSNGGQWLLVLIMASRATIICSSSAFHSQYVLVGSQLMPLATRRGRPQASTLSNMSFSNQGQVRRVASAHFFTSGHALACKRLPGTQDSRSQRVASLNYFGYNGW